MAPANQDGKIENIVRKTMCDIEQRAFKDMQTLKKDGVKYEELVCATRQVATEQVTLAKEFPKETSDDLVRLRKRLRKHLPEHRIKMIQECLSQQTCCMAIKSGDGHRSVNITGGGTEAPASCNLATNTDIDWAMIMHYAGIVIDAVLLVLNVSGIKIPGEAIIKKAATFAQVLNDSKAFKEAIKFFIDTWNSTDEYLRKAKALFHLIKDTSTAGLFWTIIKPLCSEMTLYEWLVTAVTFIATISAAFAFGDVALIAEIAIAVSHAVDLDKKMANVSKLEELEYSMN